MQIDEEHGLLNLPCLLIGSTSLVYCDFLQKTKKMINYEFLEDGESLADGNSVLRAGVGGLLFGGVGAIVGAGTGKKAIKKVVKSMKTKVTFDDLELPVAYIDVLGRQNNGTKTDGKEYKAAFTAAQECIALLNVIMQHNKVEKAPKQEISVADEILKFKQLLDMGAITQEEFDAKKEQLL